jgi:hypothetical protein
VNCQRQNKIHVRPCTYTVSDEADHECLMPKSCPKDGHRIQYYFPYSVL